MKLALFIVMAAATPARAAVAASAEAASQGTVPRVTLQTSLVPLSGPALGASLTPALTPALPAASVPSLAAMELPVLPASVVAAKSGAVAISPAALAARSVLAAPSTPDAPKPGDGPAPKADPAAPAFKTRILAMLKSMANPFGGKKAEDAPPASEAERLDREFSKTDFWAQVAPGVRAEIEKARAAKTSKAGFKAFVRAEADAAIERIKAARGISNLGFHYNLHGGRREDYVGTGIRATMGDIALRYSMNGDTNYKVYFFQSAEHGGFGPLDATHGEHIFMKVRMGYALSLFDLDAPALAAARADGRIKNFGSISMDFHGMGGVPYAAYIAPPLEVFTKTAKKVGLSKLSWDEETLATVRYIEAAALAGGPFVPR